MLPTYREGAVLRRAWDIPGQMDNGSSARLRRRDRLKAVFEARKAALNALHRIGWPHVDTRAYGAAVVRYGRARRAWRFFRGWD